jgi:hypothetical protein
MTARTETLARRLVRNVFQYTGGRPMRWVSVGSVAHRMMEIDADAVLKSVELARAKGWLNVEGGHSVCLTDVGRRLIMD